MKKRIAVIAGEASGDLLGASLIRELLAENPTLEIEGVAGAKMIEAGCKALCPSESLAVMGFIDPLKKLPEILSIRRRLIRYWTKNPPDIFIGIDYPDFNLSIARELKKRGVKTVQYVSPSVWAWRQNRIHKIKRAIDLMLVLFPFEEAFYQKHNMNVSFVGHPLADELPLYSDQSAARKKLGLPQDKKIIAIMPGSRIMEIKKMATPFLQTLCFCLKRDPNLVFITSIASNKCLEEFTQVLKNVAPSLPLTIFLGRSHEVMAAADALLLTSGTVTLEAALIKRPMVVAYKLTGWIYQILKRIVKVKYIALPNLIAGKLLVSEYLQKDVVAYKLGPLLLSLLTDWQHRKFLEEEFLKIHTMLKCNASKQAAMAILNLM